LLGKLVPTRRVTFVIGTDQLIRDVIAGELKFTDHADQALAVLGAGQEGVSPGAGPLRLGLPREIPSSPDPDRGGSGG
jgi:hypothetical protein